MSKDNPTSIHSTQPPSKGLEFSSVILIPVNFSRLVLHTSTGVIHVKIHLHLDCIQ